MASIEVLDVVPGPGRLVLSCALALGLAFGLAYRRRPSLLASAVVLDQRLAAGGTIAAAFELREEEPGGYVTLVREQADARLAGARLPQVLPLQRPANLGLLALILASFLAVLTIGPRAPSPSPALPTANRPSSTQAVATLPPEELALLAERAQRLLAAAKSQVGRERATEFAELIQKLRAGELDRRAALSAAATLERDIRDEAERGQQRPSDQDTPQASAQSKDSSQSERSQEERSRDSAEALARLAERLAQDTSPPTAKELEQIRQAVEKAREQARREHQAESEQRARAAQRLEEKERRLLKKQQKGELSAEDAAELEDTRRKLERLDRKKQTAEQEQSELDRQLAEAMRELTHDRKEASRFLDRAADSRSQKEERQLTDEEKRELLEQLRALKERLREGEQSGMEDKLREFERRARGQEGQKGRGEPGDQGTQSGSSVSVVPRPAAGSGQASGEGAESEGARIGKSTSPEPGTEHDPNWQGEATKGLDAKAEDKAAAARDTGEGGSESETILTAAEQGFRASSYERLYKDYRTVLEEMVKGEAISRNRRSEVERYFDLIRPRSE